MRQTYHSKTWFVLNQSDAQTEDGHATVKFDYFPFTSELEPRSAWK